MCVVCKYVILCIEKEHFNIQTSISEINVYSSVH